MALVKVLTGRMPGSDFEHFSINSSLFHAKFLISAYAQAYKAYALTRALLGVVHKLRGQSEWVGGSEKAQNVSTFTMVTRLSQS